MHNAKLHSAVSASFRLHLSAALIILLKHKSGSSEDSECNGAENRRLSHLCSREDVYVYFVVVVDVL